MVSNNTANSSTNCYLATARHFVWMYPREEISSHSQGGVGARDSVQEGVGIVKSYSMSNGNSKDPILAQKSEKLGG